MDESEEGDGVVGNSLMGERPTLLSSGVAECTSGSMTSRTIAGGSSA